MKRSSERFLTTHTGSLPRPEDLVRMMYAKEEGVPVDKAALAARIRSAVEEVVHKQVGAGVDIVNDGEMSKPSYATYVKDRLNGFGGTGNTLVYQDLVEFPNLAKRVFGDPGRSRRKTPGCNAPISVRDPQAARTDADNLRAASARVKTEEIFMSAASPGVIGLFFRNDHYPSQETYLFAIAEAMREEYEAVAKAGIVLQIDCPDLGMGRHIQYADLSLDEFKKKARLHMRRAACRHHRRRLHGAAERPLLRGRQPAPRSRVESVRGGEAARGQSVDPGRARIENQLHRAPGAHRPADRALREARRPRERDRGERLRLWHLGRPGGGGSGRGVGEDGGDGRRGEDRHARVLEALADRPIELGAR